MSGVGLIETEAAGQLFDYWDEIRGDRMIPGREAFNPMRIPETLPFMFVTEAGIDTMAFRLLGTELDRLVPPGAKPKDSMEMVDEELRVFFRALCSYRMRHQVITFRKSRLRLLSGSRVSAEILHLPMLNNDGESIQIFGCIVPKGTVDRDDYFAFGDQFEVIDEIWLTALEGCADWDDLPTDMTEYFSRHNTAVHFGAVDTAEWDSEAAWRDAAGALSAEG